jgi:F-type H+-transporting ATPase subunit c
LIFEFTAGQPWGAGGDELTTKTYTNMMLAELTGNLTGNIHIGLAFGGAAIGIGIAAAGGVMAIGRNPGAFGKIFTTMLIGMALAEGLAILAWIVIH